MTNLFSYAIFGKAEAIKFVDGRDKATKGEIAQRPWKKDWPIYLRVTNPVFIDGAMGDCVLLDDLIKFTFIKPEEHSAYENKREHDSSDRRELPKCPDRFGMGRRIPGCLYGNRYQVVGRD